MLSRLATVQDGVSNLHGLAIPDTTAVAVVKDQVVAESAIADRYCPNGVDTTAETRLFEVPPGPRYRRRVHWNCDCAEQHANRTRCGPHHCDRSYHIVIAVWSAKEAESQPREMLGDYARNLGSSVRVTRAG
jgi:hypothetical protein